MHRKNNGCVEPRVGANVVNCQEFDQQITPAVDHYLDSSSESSFNEHAYRCSHCRRAYEAERVTKELIHVYVKMVKSPDFVSRAIHEHLMREAEDPPMGNVPRRLSN
jgi:hypothetical protein